MSGSWVGWIIILEEEENGQLSHYSYSVLTFKDRVRGILPMDRDTNGTLGSLLCMGEVSRDRDTYRFLGRGRWLG